MFASEDSNVWQWRIIVEELHKGLIKVLEDLLI
jgi:hypothetical protein